MIYIVFSDVHGNLESLETFVQISGSIVHDKKVCLGDIVGYGADPNPCVEWVKENVDIVLGGNHDYAAVEKTDVSYFNPHAYQACLWTRRELTRDNIKYLRSLSAAREEDGVFWVHSSPFEPERWHYVTSLYDGMENFAHFNAPICFLGHSHRPLILEQDVEGQVDAYPPSALRLNAERRYIVNVGSLGQPRDGNPDPAFAIFDSDLQTLEFRRYKYDLQTAQKKILEKGLPPFLAERLSYGI
ncbi:MAG: metallophosphoesterase family protein [Nitrospinae bacterium]|nr:metallophosphoesterase family protein [Nitrospinota bacterium]